MATSKKGASGEKRRQQPTTGARSGKGTISAPLPTDDENFAISLADSCRNHAAWLAVMRYGMGTLLNNQPLLIEIIMREAERMAADDRREAVRRADFARTILGELNLRLVIAEDTQTPGGGA